MTSPENPNPPPSNPEALLNRSPEKVPGFLPYRKRINQFLLFTSGIAVTAILTAFITFLMQHLSSNVNIEYSSEFGNSFLVTNLEKVSKLIVDGKTYDNPHFLEIKFYNRTEKDIDDFKVKVSINNNFDTPALSSDIHPFHKLILYPEYLDKNWITWTDVVNNDDLEFSVKEFKRSWDKYDYVVLRIFVNTDEKPQFSIRSTMNGVRFVPFDIESNYWYFFGFDKYIIGLLIIAGFSGFLFVIFIIGRIFEKFIISRQLLFFTDAIGKSMLNCKSNEEDWKIYRKCFYIFFSVYFYSLSKPNAISKECHFSLKKSELEEFMENSEQAEKQKKGNPIPK